jgi:glycerol-3-phosphate dehydrogenase (NAD(P)+)
MGVNPSQPILVAGAGSWGTALAVHLARIGFSALLWGRDADAMAAMAEQRVNSRYLPGVDFPAAMTPIADLEAGLQKSTDVLLTVPCNAVRSLLASANPQIAAQRRYVCACKGLEAHSHKLVADIVRDVLGDVPIAVLTGPSFAKEVAAGLPTAVTIASTDASFARDLVDMFHSGSLRAYTIDDLIGVQVGGACKNVLAIAAGVSDGLGFGANARAALITRGLAEITRLGLALGARTTTFMGLAGLGDLVLTCTDNQSRNRRMGLALAEGLSVSAAEQRIGQVVEGASTAFAVVELAAEKGVEMPIAEQVVKVLDGRCTPRQAVEALLARDPTQEFPGRES